MARATRRADGEAHIREYRDGWRGSIRLQGRRRYVRGRTRREVVAKIDRLKADAGAPAKPHGDTTVAEWLETWFAVHVRRIRPSTQARYRGLIDHHLVPALGRTRLVDLTPLQVGRFLDAMQADGLSPRSALQARCVLAAALSMAEAEGLVTRNAARQVAAPRYVRPEVRPLRPDEAAAVLDAAKSRPASEQARWTIALTLGLRQGEVLGLTWSDIDLQSGSLTVAASLGAHRGDAVRAPLKTTQSARTLILSPELTDLLDEVRQSHQRARVTDPGWNPHDLIFVTRSGRPVSPRNDHRRWKALLGRAGVPPRRLHDARHTAATAMLDAGLDIKDVSTVLGHSGITLTLDTYVHRDGRHAGDVGTIVTRHIRESTAATA